MIDSFPNFNDVSFYYSFVVVIEQWARRGEATPPPSNITILFAARSNIVQKVIRKLRNTTGIIFATYNQLQNLIQTWFFLVTDNHLVTVVQHNSTSKEHVFYSDLNYCRVAVLLVKYYMSYPKY